MPTDSELGVQLAQSGRMPREFYSNAADDLRNSLAYSDPTLKQGWLDAYKRDLAMGDAAWKYLYPGQPFPDYRPTTASIDSSLQDSIPTASTMVLPTSDSGMSIKQGVGDAFQTVQDFVEEHPVAAGATALGLAGALGATVYGIKRTSSSKRRRHGSTTRRGSKGRKLKFGSPAWRKRYLTGKRGKSKSRNKRGGAVKDRYKGHKVLRTKRGQPYIILKSGKARFVRA